MPVLRLDSLAATTRADWGSVGRSSLRHHDTVYSPKRAEWSGWGERSEARARGLTGLLPIFRRPNREHNNCFSRAKAHTTHVR
jgi:hypothetical protein